MKHLALVGFLSFGLVCGACTDSDATIEGHPAAGPCTLKWEADQNSPHIQKYGLLFRSGRIGIQGELEPEPSPWLELTGKEWAELGPFEHGDRLFSIAGCSMREVRMPGRRIAGVVSYLEFILAAPRKDLLKLAGDWTLVLERRGRKMKVSVRELVAMDSTPEGNL